MTQAKKNGYGYAFSPHRKGTCIKACFLFFPRMVNSFLFGLGGNSTASWEEMRDRTVGVSPYPGNLR